MRHFHVLKNRYHCPTFNLDKIWTLVSEDVFAAAQKANNGTAPVIDITQHGFFKLMGRGDLPKVPVIVKAKFFTKLAEKKIKEAGGACLLVA
jgi:large subunit ribosomal protein L27Ae